MSGSIDLKSWVTGREKLLVKFKFGAKSQRCFLIHIVKLPYKIAMATFNLIKIAKYL